MDIRKINDALSVAGQIRPNDMAVIAAMGFKSIICNRPDGEEAFQPLFEAVETEARLADIRTAHVPVAPTGPTVAEAAKFANAFDMMPKPVLAYCRSGARSRATWALTANGQAG